MNQQEITKVLINGFYGINADNRLSDNRLSRFIFWLTIYSIQGGEY